MFPSATTLVEARAWQRQQTGNNCAYQTRRFPFALPVWLVHFIAALRTDVNRRGARPLSGELFMHVGDVPSGNRTLGLKLSNARAKSNIYSRNGWYQLDGGEPWEHDIAWLRCVVGRMKSKRSFTCSCCSRSRVYYLRCSFVVSKTPSLCSCSNALTSFVS